MVTMGSWVAERALSGLEGLASIPKDRFEMVSLGALKVATYLYDPSDNTVAPLLGNEI